MRSVCKLECPLTKLFFFFGLVLAAVAMTAQSKHPTHTPPHPIQVANPAATEPHHKTIFVNPKTRVYRIDLPAHGATELHTHVRDYVMIALTTVHAENEFDTSRTRTEANTVAMSPGDMQIMKVPQTIRLVNQADAPMSLLEIEIAGGFHPDLIVCGMGHRDCPSDVGDISDPKHQFGINALVETDTIRVRDITVGPGAILPARLAKHDFLRIAVTPLDLKIGASQSSRMNPGDVQWLTAGDIPEMINNADHECRFYEIEFK